METIKQFTHPQFGEVRTLLGANGEPLFVAKDVAAALGYTNPLKAIRDHVFFSATVQKSPMSIPARVMTEHSLDRVVYFVLRGGSDEQRAALAELLAQSLLTRVPLKRGRNREMWICRTRNSESHAQHFEDYDTILQHIFGPTCRIRVHILLRIAL